MQVNKNRFPAVLPHFLELLETCEFYAFDEEMTGINVPEMVESVTFSPEESYQAKRRAASRYSIIQVGICLFHRDEVAGDGGGKLGPVHYTARPFNFILFPNWTDELAQLQLSSADGNNGSAVAQAGLCPGDSVAAGAGGGVSGRGVNHEVVLSPSALAFLRRHGMDFQQWVYEGVSLCDAAGEALLRRHLAAKDEAAGGGAAEGPSTVVFLTDEEKAWVGESIAVAEELVKRVAEVDNAEPAVTPTPTVSTLSREVMLKPQSSSNAREHFRLYARQHLPSLRVTFRRQGGGGAAAMTSVTVTALTAAEAQRKAEKEAAVRTREVMDLLGFRLVFNALVESRKPCVGHNCFADLLFLMASLDQPLPESLSAWKARVSTLFPQVLDTKYLVSRKDLFPPGRFPANYLGGLFEQYGLRSRRVAVTLPLGFEAYDPIALLGSGDKGSGGGGPAHEAGFDAMMTGVLLLNLLAEVGGCGAEALGVRGVAPELANKIALFRSLYAVDLANPSADEYVPDTAAPSMEVAVLDLRHEAGVKTAQLESMLAAGAAEPLHHTALYSVDPQCTRTLAVVSFPKDGGASSSTAAAATLAQRLATRFPSQLKSVVPYVPPHQLSSPPHGAAFRFPSSLEKTLLRSCAFPRK